VDLPTVISRPLTFPTPTGYNSGEMRAWKGIVAVLIVLAVSAALTIAVLDFSEVRLVIAHPALASNSPALNASEVEQLLSQHFNVRRNVSQLPPPLKESFSSVTHQSFAMANPGEPFNTDVVILGRPNACLEFAAISESAAVLVYWQGAYVTRLNVLIFDFNRKKSWFATLDKEVAIDDIADLRAAIRGALFRVSS
jgi:hypothetical protein